MMDPELFAEFLRAFIEEWNRAVAEADSGRDGAIREPSKVERRLKVLIEASGEGFQVAGLQDQMAVLEARRLELTAKLAAVAPTQPWLRPNLADAYRAKMEQRHSALEAGAEEHGALKSYAP